MTWQLRYAGDAHDFGDVHVAGIQIDGSSYRTEDESAVDEDGIIFGIDRAEAGDITLRLSIDSGAIQDEAQARRYAREQSEQFKRIWDASEARINPGEVVELWADEFGLLEGRPRGVDWDWATYATGFLKGRARFVRQLPVTYLVAEGGPSWQEVMVGIVSPDTGGLVAPLIAPLSTARPTTRAQDFLVSGDTESWPTITVRGPLQDGGHVDLVGLWQATLNRALAAGDIAVFETKPPLRSMKLNGRPVNILAPGGARLDQMVLPPGQRSIALRGTSVEGTATVSVRWRDTKAGI